MTLKAMAAALRKLGIFNDWGIANSTKTATVYYTGYTDRWSHNVGWSVNFPGRVINKSEAWYARAETLPFLGLKFKEKEKAFAEATKATGIKDWTRSPFTRNAYVSAAALEKLLQ